MLLEVLVFSAYQIRLVLNLDIKHVTCQKFERSDLQPILMAFMISSESPLKQVDYFIAIRDTNICRKSKACIQYCPWSIFPLPLVAKG